MKVFRAHYFASILLLVFFIGGTQVAQSQTLVADDSSLSGASLENSIGFGGVLAGEPGAGVDDSSPANPQSAGTAAESSSDRLKVVLYPIMAWAPVFGANVRLPDTPSTPGGGSGSTNTSINGAAMFGFTVQKAKWYGDWNGMYAGMTASRATPHLNLDVNGFFSGAQVGYKVYDDFYFTGGFRHMGIDYTATLGDFQPFKRSPGVWDPLVGILWNKQVSKKWTLKANVQGGGFGVGSDVDVSATGNADWQFAKHFGLTLGYGVIHFKISDTKLGQTFAVSQTLNGPQFGFGIYF